MKLRSFYKGRCGDCRYCRYEEDGEDERGAGVGNAWSTSGYYCTKNREKHFDIGGMDCKSFKER